MTAARLLAAAHECAGRARRALATPIAWVAGAIIVAAFGVAVSVHGALLDIAKGLPV